MTFEILLEDEHLIAINKPTGILVHRTSISTDTRFVLQLLRDQIGQRLFPVHRLDRPTSGVLIFGKTKAAAAHLSAQFKARQVNKIYWAIIRGYVPQTATIDYALTSEAAKTPQAAISHYRRLAQTEIAVAVGRYPTARYSWVEVRPETGRMHQIRRHFAHIRHPIIGDKKHGDNKHNTFFREKLSIGRLLLHARKLTIEHMLGGQLSIEAPLDADFEKALEVIK